MGQYKVPQNVEAEDKILGPLSLKQFIYAMIGVGYGLLTFAIFRSVILIWIIIGLPPMLFMLALGLYQRQDQPFEAFFVGVLQFLTRPRKRYWEKEPIMEVFRVEPPPPKPEIVRRDPREVRGQLSHLANLIDTRGWTTKQPELQEPEEAPVIDLRDRLGADVVTQQLPAATDAQAAADITQDDDVLNTTSAKAADLNVLIEDTVKNIRQEALQNMQHQATKRPATAKATKKAAATSGNNHTANAIMDLATEGGDLTVSALAEQAKRRQNQLTEGQAISVRPT